MNFELPDTAEQLRTAIRRWVDSDVQRQGAVEAFRPTAWASFLTWDLLSPDFGDHLHRTVGLMESVRGGLPGPVLEARLAVCADPSGDSAAALASGQMVSSVLPDRPGPLLVGWGAVADRVVDQRTGRPLATTPLPEAQLAYSVPHGWLDVDETVPVGQNLVDPLAADRWLLGATLISGLVDGAIEVTTEHVLQRHQFGKPLAAFQAVQMPLAELKVWADGLRLSTIDAALRRDRGSDSWTLAASLAWLAAVKTADRATKVGYQSFGALGFCNETGLVQLTWSMSWLTLSVGVASARRFALDSRNKALELQRDGEPGCLVFEGSSL